jgi:hypothetical protein
MDSQINLRDFQNMAIENIRKNEIDYNCGSVLAFEMGLGKCHAENTPILMYNGEIKMVQDINVGELLMGDDRLLIL